MLVSLNASLSSQAVRSVSFVSPSPTGGLGLSVGYLPIVKVLVSGRVIDGSLGTGSLGSRLGI